MSAIDKLYEIVTLRLGTSEECCPEQGLICSAGAHLRPRGRQADYVSVCPLAQRARVRERIAEDVARLKGLIENANVSGGFGLWGYDVHRHPKASEALDAAWAFVDEPEGGLLLAGPMGLGKTRLLLGVHFELLCAGIDSRFVLSSELREAFRQVDDAEHVLPFQPPEAIAAAVEASGLRVIASERATLQAWAPDLRQLLADIKTLGAHQTGAARRKPLRKSAWARLQAAYEQHRSAAGLPASYDTFWLIAEKRP